MPKKTFWGNCEDWDSEDYCTDHEDCEIELLSKEEVDLMNSMKALWEQHVAWTRMAIISIAANLPDLNCVLKRLLRNPKDMANALKPFYGNKNALQFKNLMENHLTIAAQLVEAAKASNTKAAAAAEKKWYANADDIAAFLSSINPYWSDEDLKAMLYDHLSLTKKEAVARLAGNYARDIALYDKIENQALAMADALTEGIFKQFPDTFTGQY